MKYAYMIVGLPALILSPDFAQACVDGARCLKPPVSSAPAFEPGDILQPGTFNILLNSEYHGLPRADQGTWYVTINRYVLRIESRTYVVIEDVTSQARRAF